jgi:hypothetical protein
MTKFSAQCLLFILLFSLTTQTSFAQSVSPNYQLYNSYTSLGVSNQNSANFNSTSGVVVTPGKFVSPNFSAISDSIKPVQPEIPEPPNPPSPAQSAGPSGSIPSIQFSNLRTVVSQNTASISFSTDRLARTYISYALTNSNPVTTPMTLNLGLNHTFLIENLSPNTSYYFQLQALDSANRLTISRFYTLVTSPLVPIEPTPPETPSTQENQQEPTKPPKIDIYDDQGFPEIVISIPSNQTDSNYSEQDQDSVSDLQLNFGFDDLNQNILDKLKQFLNLSQAPKLTVYANTWSVISISQSKFSQLPERVYMTLDGRKYLMRKNDQNQTYQTKIRTPRKKGNYKLTLQTQFPDGSSSYFEHILETVPKSQVVSEEYYDFQLKNPFKFLFKKSVPIKNAKLEFFILNQNSKWELWEANFYAQNNPIFTDKNGHFTVQLPTSQFTIRVSKGKNLTYQTEPFKATQNLLSKSIVVNPSFNYRLAIFTLVLFGIFALFVLKSVRKK